jgi:hypothetical protein
MVRGIDIDKVLEAHARGVKRAIEISIRTGTPLITEKNGKIVKIVPKYKYVKVPIKVEKKKIKISKKLSTKKLKTSPLI